VEVTIANHRNNSFNVVESKNDRVEFMKNAKFSARSTKEAMTNSKAGPFLILGGLNPEEKKSVPFKDMIRRRPTLKELQEKRYLFPDFDLSRMLDDLLEKAVIHLSDPKRPEDIGRIADLNTVVTILRRGWIVDLIPII